MGIISKMLLMDVVYWPLASPSRDEYGRPAYGTAVQIKCRWEDVNEQFLDDEGTVRVSRAKVYTDRDVDLGGVLMLGELSSGIDTDDPKANDGAWEIKKFEKVPDLKVTEYLRTAYL